MLKYQCADSVMVDFSHSSGVKDCTGTQRDDLTAEERVSPGAIAVSPGPHNVSAALTPLTTTEALPVSQLSAPSILNSPRVRSEVSPDEWYEPTAGNSALELPNSAINVLLAGHCCGTGGPKTTTQNSSSVASTHSAHVLAPYPRLDGNEKQANSSSPGAEATSAMMRSHRAPLSLQSSSNNRRRSNVSPLRGPRRRKDAVVDDEDYTDGQRFIVQNPLKGRSFTSSSGCSLNSPVYKPEILTGTTSTMQKVSFDDGNRVENFPELCGEETVQVKASGRVEGPWSSRHGNLIELHAVDSDEERSLQEKHEARVCCTLSSLPAVTFIMCFGAIIVGLLGFLPFYFVGVQCNSRTTEYLLSEAMKGVASITQNSLAMLPAFVHIVTFNYIKRHNTTLEETNFPDNPERLMRSLLTVLTRFNASVTYLRFVYEGGLYTNAGYTNPVSTDASQTQRIYGGYSRTSDLVPMLEMHNESVTVVEPPNVLGYFDFNREITHPGGPMNQIVNTWLADPQNTTRWLLASDNATSTYFNFAMPFLVNGKLGYCVAGSPSDAIIRETTTLVGFLRANGRIFLVDPLRNILVVNSWNQSVQHRTPNSSVGATIYTPTYIYEITEPIILAAMKVVNQSGSWTEVLRNRDTALISFPFKGNNAFLNLTKVKDSYGLDLVLGVVVVRADFESAFSTARTVVITVTVVVVVIAAVVSVVIAWFVVREMKRLIPQLIRASNLEVSNNDDRDYRVQGWLAYITEIRGIHEAFVRVERSLREMRTFVPAAVMTLAPSDGSRDDNDFADGKTRRVRSRFNANIVKDNTNEFSCVDVAMVLVDVHCALDTAEACAMMDIISQHAEEYTGFIESVSSSSFFVNFGTQSQNPLVVSKICRFALDVYLAVPEYMRSRVVCFAVRMPFLVGTCGARHSKARVVFDTQRMLDISKVLWDIGCHVASTTDTLSHFATSSAQIPWYRIDCVRFPDEVSQVTLCELLDPCSSLEDNANISKKMGDGLSKMCKGEYREAILTFDSAHSENVHLKRLRQICVDRIASGDTSKYIHLIQDVYTLDTTSGDQDEMLMSGGAAMYDYDANGLAGANASNGEVSALLTKGTGFERSSPEDGVGMESSSFGGIAAEALPLFERNVTLTGNPKAVLSPSGSADGEAVEPFYLTERAVATGMGPPEFPAVSASPVTGVGSAGLGLPPLPPRAPGIGATATSMPGSSSPLGAGEDNDSEAPSFLTGAFVFESSVASAEAVGVVAQSADEPQVLRDVNHHEWQLSLYPIGRGAFSFIYLGMSDDGVQVAIKRIPRLHRGIKEEEMVSEVCTCAKLRHPNIVPYISCCVTQSYLAIVMEYMPGGSLHDIIDNFGKLPRTVVRRFMLDIVNGLAYLHESTTHGDVKPHNILLGVDGVCKLSDFGSASDKLTEACCVNEDRLMRGTAVYISPEGAQNLPLTSASDIYSLGISFLEMVLGRLPWKWADAERTDLLPLRHDHEFVQCLTANVIVVDIPDNLDNDIRELALASCAECPEDRPTAQELLSFAFLI